MRVCLIALLWTSLVSPLPAADELRLAIMSKAQTEFSAVENAATPRLPETSACIQAQAAWLAVASREEMAEVYYRKGYCTLASASVTRQAGDFSEAAAQLEKAIELWPARLSAGSKNRVPESVPSGLPVLAAIARLQAGADEAAMDRARGEIASAVQTHECASGVMREGGCRAILGAGRQWLGWLDLRRDNLVAAARDLAGAEASGWTAWAAGRKAFRDAHYSEAAAEYRHALAVWEAAKQQAAFSSLIGRLGPPVDWRTAWRDLGSAHLLAGSPPAAIESLNRAVKEDPPDARALYLRARARELAGQMEAAQADYNMASRTAFAAGAAGSGDAHLYRGILFYRRNDFAHAEEEFASALNFEIAPPLRADASAWRHLAAVSAGACGASRDNLERALPAASPFFPRDEARARLGACAPPSAARHGL